MTVFQLRVSPDHRRLAVLTEPGVTNTWYVVEVDSRVRDDTDRIMGAVYDSEVEGWDAYHLCPLDPEEPEDR